MVAYGDALYSMGGWNGGEVKTMERYSKGKGWESLGNIPYDNHRFGLVLC